jgi:glutamyl-tRNA reductase
VSTLVRIGLDGHGARLHDRERWALDGAGRDRLHAAARERGWGLVALTTCFRVEVYLDGPPGAADAVGAWLSVGPGARPEDSGAPALPFGVQRGSDAFRHLCRVAVGLESAVLGEAEVLGQVRQAQAAAAEAGTLTPLLREAFRAAIATARVARAETALGRGGASTATAAVRLAAATAHGLTGRHVVVVGGGEIGRLLLKHLHAAAPARLDLVSRRPGPSGVATHAPDALPGLLVGADVVFTGTDRTVITPDDLGGRAPRPLTIVDLGVPRNVVPSVGAVPGVRLHDVDALRGVVDEALVERRAAVPAAEGLVGTAVEAFAGVEARLVRERLVADLRRQAERTRRAAVAAVCGRCADATCLDDAAPEARPGPGPCSDPDRLTRTLTTRLLHDLTAGLRAGADAVDDATLRRLFALPEPPVPRG